VVRIGTEVYGSPIHSTWFDRPLAVAGRVFLKGSAGPREVLVRTEALGLFPNLAIHYNREVNKGQAYDLAEHLSFLAALGPDTDLQGALARRLGFDRTDWLAADLFVVDPVSPTALGEGLFLAPRIDNLTGCHAVVASVIASTAPSPLTRLAFCFDQEEIGSATWTGADSSWLGDLMARVHGLNGGTPEGLFRAKAASFVLSVDAAHGVHPNWAGQHDDAYAPLLGQGPVLKSSARFSYATTAASEARVRSAAERAGVNLQTYVMKSTLTPGSTVGPITTSWTGIPGADVGIPIWAMHSSNESADRRDQAAMVKLVTELFRG
jgi:aspartyl aminopeptidase